MKLEGEGPEEAGICEGIMGMDFGEAVFLGRVSFFRRGNSKWPSHGAWRNRLRCVGRLCGSCSLFLPFSIYKISKECHITGSGKTQDPFHRVSLS